MQVQIESLALANISESTYTNYKHRLERLQEITKQSLEWILQNPIDSIKHIKVHVSTNPSTIANFIVAICKLFSVNPRYQKLYAEPYNTWQKYLKHYRKEEITHYKTSQFTDKQQKNLIGWNEVKDKYCSLKSDPTTTTDPAQNQACLLLSLFLNINAKRADLGNIRIHKTDPKDESQNYIFLSATPTLVINKYKTAGSRGAIREPLNPQVTQDIKQSLASFPRQYLIISQRTQTPYTINNSYSQYVKRTFEKLFGRSMGVSLWRHIYITANVDFNNTSYQELEKLAHLKGHSLQQEFLSYRKLPTTTNYYKRPKPEMNRSVICPGIGPSVSH